VLYAPFKDFVFVNGSFNDWNLSQENQMNQTPDGKRYWITISGLTPAQEYAYQYVIDGSLTVADAYCDKVLDPWNDQYISSETYPDLMDYPEGKKLPRKRNCSYSGYGFKSFLRAITASANVF